MNRLFDELLLLSVMIILLIWEDFNELVIWRVITAVCCDVERKKLLLLIRVLCCLQTEIAELRHQQLASDSSASKNGVEKLKKEYLQKLNLLEDQVNFYLFVCGRME